MWLLLLQHPQDFFIFSRFFIRKIQKGFQFFWSSNRFFSIQKIQKVFNSFGAQTESFSIQKIPKVFNSFGAQTDSSPFGKFKKFSIPLELKLET
jgi:hypothetical protein